MKLLEERILKDGKVLDGDILKVDSFLNHQIDVQLAAEMGKEFYKKFGPENVTKILTIEASGIAIACLTAHSFGCPVLFAKKTATSNLSEDVYSAEVFSYTHGKKNNVLVSKQYLSPSDRVLIVDDFAANGEAARGLISLVKKAGATLVGVGIAIEKGYQGGGDALRKEGVDVYSLAIVDKMDKNGIVFRKQQ